MLAEEKLHIAVSKILTRSALRLFGCIIYKFDILLIDKIGDGNNTAAVSINHLTRKPTIKFCIKYVDTLTINQLIFDIFHEMVHFIDGHLNNVRTQNKDKKIFNLAADHIINTMLEEDSKNSLKDFISPPPHTHFLVPHFIGKKTSLNEVYEWLMNNTSRINIIINNVTGQGTVSIGGTIIGTINLDLTRDPNDNNDNIIEEEVIDELRSELRSIINNVLENSSRGVGTSNIYEYIKEITRLEIPWEVLLDNCIRGTLCKSNENKTWKQPRKRLRTHNIILPDIDHEFTIDSLYVLQDTSGSVGTKDQEKFVNIISQSINHFSKIVIVQHDYNITNKLILTTENFDLNKDKIFSIHGRGGTSHTDCFNFLESEFFEEEQKIGLVIILSDYESNIEQIWNNYKFHEFVNIKVLCTGTRKISPLVDDSPIRIQQIKSPK
jgi:predicted metal-dependent peptidase